MAGRLIVSAALYVAIIATGIAATPLPGLPTADDQLEEHDNNANTERRGGENSIDIGLEIHKLHLRMGKGYVHAGEADGGKDDVNRVKEVPLVNASNGSEIQNVLEGNRLVNQETGISNLLQHEPDLEPDSRGTDNLKLTVELEDLQISSGDPASDGAPSELFALEDQFVVRLDLEEDLVHLESSGSLDRDFHASSEASLNYSGIPPNQKMPGGSVPDAGLISGFGGLEDELALLEYSGSPVHEDSTSGDGLDSGVGSLEGELALLEYTGSPVGEDSTSGAGLSSGVGGLEDEVALLEYSASLVQEGSASGDGLALGLELEDELTLLQYSGSPIREGSSSGDGLDSGLGGLVDELEPISYSGSPIQERSTSRDGLASGFGGLKGELEPLQYSGSPVDEGSTSGADLNSGFGSPEDESTLFEYSGSRDQDSSGLPPMEMSSSDGDLPLQRLFYDHTPFSGEGSGSGTFLNDGFQDLSLRPSLPFLDEVDESSSGNYDASNYRDRHNGVMFPSGSGDSSSDGSGDVGNQGIPFTIVPQLEITTPPIDGSHTLDPHATPDGLVLDAETTEPHSDRSGQGERKEKPDTVVITPEDKLELELEGMSLVVSDVAPVNEDEEAASLEQVDPSQRTHKDYTTPVPRGNSISPTISPSLEDVELLTSGVPLTMLGAEPESGCRADQMACADGRQCVPIESTCDMVVDCLDGSDEDDALCEPSRRCGAGFTKCGSSAQCVRKANLCDGIYHCYNGHDEKDCLWCVDPNGKQHMLTVDDLCDGVKDCADASDENIERCEAPCTAGYRKCQDGLQCVKDKLFCNGVHNCRDESDEMNCERTPSECDALGMFACDGLCHPMTARCDYTYDCTDGSDERHCP